MNELQEKILALLVAKFQGVRKDGLQQLAAAIGLQVANEEEANQVVDKLTADKVSAFVTDWRRNADAEIKKANDTYEEGLRRKYDFKEKEKPGSSATQTPPAETGGAVTLEAISKLIDDKLKGVQDSITTLNADKAATSRRELFVAKLDESKVEGRQREMMLRNFDRANSTFEKDEDFNNYLTEVQGDIAALQQERADAGLQGHEKPIFGAVNKDGISSGVADYIKTQTESNKPLTGKEV